MEKNYKVSKKHLPQGIHNKETITFNNYIIHNKEVNLKDINNNEKVQTINNKKNLEFVNNSDLIRDLIAFFRKRRLKEKAYTKTNKEINNTPNNNLKNKTKFESNIIKSNNNSHIQFNQLTEKNNKMDKQAITANNSLIKNITLNNGKKFNKNKTGSKFYFVTKRTNAEKRNRILSNDDINNALESSSFKNIKEQKQGNYKGIIEIPKSSKNNCDNKRFFNNNENYNIQEYSKKKLETNNLNEKQKLNTQRNKEYNNEDNIKYSYCKKCSKNDSNNSKRKVNISNFKFNSEIKNNYYIHDKTLSFNNLKNNLSSFLFLLKKIYLPSMKKNPKKMKLKINHWKKIIALEIIKKQKAILIKLNIQ